LCDNRQARVNCICLVDIENKVWILDEIHPETKWQAKIKFIS
jgi:hypothetical protein